jgi:hypothetical protein
MIALPYVATAFILFMFYVYGNINMTNKKETVGISFLFFLVFFGFRGYIFTDVFSYKPFFDRALDLPSAINSDLSRWSWWEPGFVYYCSFFKTFTNNYIIFQFFDTLIDLILLYKALEWFNANTCLNYMIFFALNGMSVFIDALRYVKLILLFFIALRYIYDRKIITYFLFCFIALSFHVGSIIMFPMYFLLSIKYSKITYLILFFISIVLFFWGASLVFGLFNNIIGNYISGRASELISIYVLSADTAGLSGQRVLSLGVLEKILTFFLVLICYKSLYRGKNIIIMNCFLFYFIFYFAFSGFYFVSNRLSLAFVFSYWILWPLFLKCIHNKPLKQLFLICLLTYALLKMSLYSQYIQRYENVLFGAMNYEQRDRWNQVWWNSL